MEIEITDEEEEELAQRLGVLNTYLSANEAVKSKPKKAVF